MTPLDALITLAVFMFVVVPLAVAVCALSRIRHANESDRLGDALAVWDYLEAQPEFNEEMERAKADLDPELVAAFAAVAVLRPDPAKTAGGIAGKRWDTYAAQTNVVSQSYTGGCGDQLYYVPNPAIDDEYDHHTKDAIYRSKQHSTETLP